MTLPPNIAEEFVPDIEHGPDILYSLEQEDQPTPVLREFVPNDIDEENLSRRLRRRFLPATLKKIVFLSGDGVSRKEEIVELFIPQRVYKEFEAADKMSQEQCGDQEEKPSEPRNGVKEFERIEKPGFPTPEFQEREPARWGDEVSDNKLTALEPPLQRDEPADGAEKSDQSHSKAKYRNSGKGVDDYIGEDLVASATPLHSDFAYTVDSADVSSPEGESEPAEATDDSDPESENTHPDPPQQLVKQSFERDDHKCRNCGLPGGNYNDVKLNAFYIVDPRQGGNISLGNIIALCDDCFNLAVTERPSNRTNEEYPPNWDKLRRQAYQNDDYRCRNCRVGGGKHGEIELHAHHIVPRSKRGNDTIDNLATLCSSCHNLVHDHMEST